MELMQSIETTSKDDLLKQYEHVKIVGQGNNIQIYQVLCYDSIFNKFCRFIWHCGFV